MTDNPAAKQPTDHLPPADERGPDDERTTADGPRDPAHRAGAHGDAGGVDESTAAEPSKPDRHGVAKLPPTDR